MRKFLHVLAAVSWGALAVWAPAQECPTPAPEDPVKAAIEKAGEHILAYQTMKAKEALGSVEGRAKDDPLVAQALAEVLVQQRKYDDAVKLLTAATKLAPLDPEPFVVLGDTYLLMKKNSTAVAAYTEALKLADAKVKVEPELAQGYYQRGVASQRLRQFDRSAEALTKALQLKPDDPLTEYELGKTRAFQGKWQDAVDVLTKAIEKNSGIAYAYYYRGLAAEKVGKKDMLVNDMDRFLFLAPEAPEAAKAKAIVAAAKR